MAGGIVQTLIFYKCPNCGKRFNIRVNWSSGWLVFMRIVQRYFSTKIQTILQSRLIRNTRRDAAAVCYWKNFAASTLSKNKAAWQLPMPRCCDSVSAPCAIRKSYMAGDAVQLSATLYISNVITNGTVNMGKHGYRCCCYWWNRESYISFRRISGIQSILDWERYFWDK